MLMYVFFMNIFFYIMFFYEYVLSVIPFCKLFVFFLFSYFMYFALSDILFFLFLSNCPVVFLYVVSFDNLSPFHPYFQPKIYIAIDRLTMCCFCFFVPFSCGYFTSSSHTDSSFWFHYVQTFVFGFYGFFFFFYKSYILLLIFGRNLHEMHPLVFIPKYPPPHSKQYILSLSHC